MKEAYKSKVRRMEGGKKGLKRGREREDKV